MTSAVRSCRSVRAAVARLAAAVLLAAASQMLGPLASVARLEAQSCPLSQQCNGNAPPTVTIFPHWTTVTSPTLNVSVQLSDDYKLNLSTFAFTINGTAQAITLTSTQQSVASGSTTITLNAGLNVLTAFVRDDKGLPSPVDSAFVTYTTVPPQSAPTIQLTAQHNGYRPGSPCPMCTATFAYSTPAYITLDAPRSLTLAYSSATAAPVVFVQVDAAVTATTQPSTLSLKLKRPDGAYVTLSNGLPEVFYKPDSSGTTRLAAQFDASGSAYPTGAYNLTAEVSATYGGTSYTSSGAIRVLVVNEQNSPLGKGVSWVGIPRLYPDALGGVMFTAGDGSAAYFTPSGCSGGTCTFASPVGVFTTLDSAGGVYRLRGRSGNVLRFQPNGLVLSAADRFGNTTSYLWDGSQRLTTATDPTGQTITVQYGATAPGAGGTGYSTITEHALGRTSYLLYNADGTLNYVQDPSPGYRYPIGNAQYDAMHRLIDYTVRPSAASSALIARQRFTYDATGWVQTAVTSDAGGASAMATTVKSLADTLLPRAGRGVSAATADPGLAPTKAWTTVRAPNTAITSTRLDRFGLPLEEVIRGPLGAFQGSAWTRNEAGQVTAASVWPNSNKTYTYSNSYPFTSSNSTLPLTVSEAGQVTATSYDQYDQPILVTVNGHAVARYYYGGALAVLDSATVQGTTTAFQWDSRGRESWRKDAVGAITQKTYYPSGPQNAATTVAPLAFAGSGITQFRYDAGGRVVALINATGKSDSTEFDVLNRPSRTIGPNGSITRYVYNDFARTDSVIDALQQVYQTGYDHLGRVTRRVDPRGNAERWTYDALGNDSLYVNRRNQTVTSLRDSLGRMRTRIAGADTARFEYLQPGASLPILVQSNAASTDTTWTLDAVRPLQATTYRSGRAFVLTYAYDLPIAGRKQVTWSDVTGARGTVYANHDTLFRVSALVPWSTFPTSLAYSAANRLKTVTLPTSATTSAWLLDSLSFTTTLQVSASTYSIPGVQGAMTRTYKYDTLSRIDTVARPGSNGTTTRTLLYDKVGRLKSATDRGAVQDSTLVCVNRGRDCQYSYFYRQGTLFSESYSYDSVGNRLDHGASVTSGNHLDAFNGFSLSYDLDGNLVSKVKPGFAQTLHWNVLGQLDTVTTVTNTTTKTTFAYDASGRRVRKHSAGGTIEYVLDRDVLIAELDSATGQPIREYSYYPGTDRPHSVRAAGQVYYYLYEEPGHVIGLVNGNNQLVDQYTYEPFGAALTTSETVSQPFRFTGRELDAETGLYYYRARYYDPQLARFTSEDPIRLAGGINTYAYVANDPINLTDPTGLRVCFLGSRSEALTLSGYNQAVTQTSYDLDLENCVVGESVKALGDRFTELGRRFFDMAMNKNAEFNVKFAPPGPYSFLSAAAGSPSGGLAIIGDGKVTAWLSGPSWGVCDGRTVPISSQQQLLAHEFYGRFRLSCGLKAKQQRRLAVCSEYA